MANTPMTYSLSSIAQQFLPQLFTEKMTLPIGLEFTNESLVESEYHHTNDSLELVLLDTWTISELATFLSESKVTLCGLMAVNDRVNKKSFRFTVTSENAEVDRTLLVEYCLKIGKEAALIKNAPSLETPGLLVMDMDSTTIEIECIDEIAKLAGVGEQVAEVTELAMQGELDFAQSLNQRVATLEGSSESILSQVAESLPLMAGLESLISELKKHGWKIAIASGGFTYFANKLKEDLGFDDAIANELEIINKTLTGKVKGGIVDAQVKADTLSKLSVKYNIPHKQTVAMGDGANDLVMMAAANLGVAYKAKPLVLKQADTSISFSGLDLFIHWLK